jgi:hypothetical protein
MEDGRWATRAGNFIFTQCLPLPYVSLTCPPDATIPSGSTVPLYTLIGFAITNTTTFPMAFDYYLTTTGPGTLNDCGNPASLSGTTPLLPPGATHIPPNACISLPAITTYATQVVTYTVTPANQPLYVNACQTTITIEPPVAVAFQLFDVMGLTDGIQLEWAVVDHVGVEGYNVYRSPDGGKAFERLNVCGLLPANERSYFDNTVRPGREYTYQVGAVESTGETVSLPRSTSMKLVTALLEQNHPNPFNPSTTISFILPSAERAVPSVYDTQGKLVKTLCDGMGTRGENRHTWDGTNNSGQAVGSGVYYYKLSAGNFTDTRKMVLLK